MIRWAVFVSGNGSNLQNFLDLEAQNKIRKNQIRLVVADKQCRALERAQKANKPSTVLSPKAEGFVQNLIKSLEENEIDRIFLMGYMKILPSEFFRAWNKPILNLHPSLLPKYKGLHAIQKAYEAGDPELGVTIHEVVEELDSGPILKQSRLNRNEAESLESLTERIHRLEHQLVAEYLFELES